MPKKTHLPKPRQKIAPLRKWGNSLLWINLKFWKCAYCGILIKDRKPFSVTLIDANPDPFILCSPQCFKILVIKLEAQRHDKTHRWIP